MKRSLSFFETVWAWSNKKGKYVFGEGFSWTGIACSNLWRSSLGSTSHPVTTAHTHTHFTLLPGISPGEVILLLLDDFSHKSREVWHHTETALWRAGACHPWGPASLGGWHASTRCTRGTRATTAAIWRICSRDWKIARGGCNDEDEDDDGDCDEDYDQESRSKWNTV